MKKPTDFATESDLCAAFIAWVQAEGKGRWTAYAETATWDILLVRDDGTQIGVQAKLRFNLKVLQQTLPSRWDHWHDAGPDFRAILVPDAGHGYDDLASALGLVVFAPSRYDGFGPGFDAEANWHDWHPRARCRLPAFVPDVAAGASGPVQLTEWKVAALRIVAILHLRGYVTRADFREIRIDPRRWMGPQGWLRPGAEPGQYVRGEGLDFDQQHPAVFAQVLEEQRGRLLELLA